MAKYNISTLDNGLRVIHLPSASQVVWCGYELAVGSRDELSGEEGLAHFCEHMTFKGTARRSALQVINDLESVGGELNAFTNKEDTVFYAAVTRDHFMKAVNLLTDIVFNSLYPQHEIDKEVEVICDEIESYNDSPSELIYDEFENLLFKGHPLGHNILGKAELLRGFTTTDALHFTRRHYRPDNAVFFVYGDVNFKRLCDVLSRSERLSSARLLSEGRKNRDAVDHFLQGNLTPYSPLLTPQEVIIEKDTHQAHVMLGTRAYRFDDPRRMTLYLLNNIIGGPGMNARLNLSLRERHGLVYTVESSMAAYSDTGVWSVYFGCDHHDVNRCLRLVRRELDRMMTRPLSASQLIAAKRQLKGQLAIACDNREQFALDFGRSFLHHGHERDIDILFARIDAVTSEDIQQVAEELFSADNLTTLIFR
ncbi:MAG: insulinase family protein [Prevotella sp.]|nr:insulinase family protein [Prevotella sp.]